MRKNLTTKLILFLIIFGVFITPLSIQAFSTVEKPQCLSGVSEMFKSKTLLPESVMYEDIVIDDLVMYEGRSSTPCQYGTPETHKKDDFIPVLIENGYLWAANFDIHSSQLNVQLSYDAQTDVLSFRKTLGDDMDYTIAQDNSSITFYHKRKPFLIIDDIQNCALNTCATIRFLEKTTISQSDCSNTLYSASTRGSQNTPLTTVNNQHKMVIAMDTAEGINTRNFKKANTVSTHQVAPNPTNNTTTITYALTADAPVRVAIYNAIGQQIAVLVNGNQSKGEQNIEWKAAELLRGVYIYEIIAGNERKVGKIIKL